MSRIAFADIMFKLEYFQHLRSRLTSTQLCLMKELHSPNTNIETQEYGHATSVYFDSQVLQILCLAFREGNATI
jgi:hypothetical protein